MNYVKPLIPPLVKTELREANRKNPPFHSLHEGYAVLLEEIDETKEALDFLDFDRGLLWEYIKQDDMAQAMKQAKAIERQAVHLAAEAIQVAAMAEKFQVIGKEE